MHYIVDTITSRYPNLATFINELQFVEKASQVSFENVLSDLHDLEKGMELTKKESEFLKQKNEPNPVSLSILALLVQGYFGFCFLDITYIWQFTLIQVMREFLAGSEERLNKIKAECKTAVKDFGECVEFYGEERQQTDTSSFFSAILKFIRSYKVAETENEQKKRVTLRNQSPPETIKATTGKKQQVNPMPVNQNLSMWFLFMY